MGNIINAPARALRAPWCGKMGDMSSDVASTRRSTGSVVAVWIVAVVLALVIGVIAPPQWRAAWMPVGWGLCLILTFAVQLWVGRVDGFIARVAASALGALAVMGFVGIGFGLATLFAG